MAFFSAAPLGAMHIWPTGERELNSSRTSLPSVGEEWVQRRCLRKHSKSTTLFFSHPGGDNFTARRQSCLPSLGKLLAEDQSVDEIQQNLF